jgi:(2R)-sulfolactate sulfo-lyase subunit beta
MSEHIDVDTSGLLQREITMDQAGDKLLDMMFRTANGRLTAAEALGNIQKIGRKCLVDGVIDKAEMPTHPGLWFMDSSSAAAEMVTLCAASGYVVHFFPTGQGNVIGNPILPVIKICAHPRTVRTMSEHVDVDVSGLLRKEMSPDDAGDKLLECMFRTANGRLTAAEALGHREFVLTRLFESA